MPLINQASRDELDSQYVAYDHGKMQEAGFGEVYVASFAQVRDEELSTSQSLNREGFTARNKQIDQLIESGEVTDAERFKLKRGDYTYRALDYGKIAANLKRDDIKTDEVLHQERNEHLRKKREYGQDIIDRGSGMAQFLGAMSAYMLDPVNILTVGIAAPAASARATTVIGRAALTAKNAAIIEGATELGIQTLVYQHKQDIESPYSAGDALANIAFAATGAGAIGFASGGLAGWFRKVRETANQLPETAELKTAKESIQRQEEVLKGAPGFDDVVDIDAIKRDVLLEAREELTGVAGNKLSRGDVKSLKAEKHDLEYKLSQVKEPAKADVEFERARIKGADKKGKARAQKKQAEQAARRIFSESKAVLEDKLRIIDTKLSAHQAEQAARRIFSESKAVLEDKLRIIDTKLSAHQAAAKAESDLTRIDQGIIPEQYQRTIDTVANEQVIKSDVEYLKEMDNRAKQYAPPSKDKAIYEPPPTQQAKPKAPPATASQRERDILKAQGLDEVYNEEVAKYKTLETRQLDVDGEIVDADDLIKQFDDEIQGLDDVLKCAYGG